MALRFALLFLNMMTSIRQGLRFRFQVGDLRRSNAGNLVTPYRYIYRFRL